MPARRGAAARRAPNRAKVAEEQIRCYELRLSGLSFERISAQTGLSVGTVHNRISAHINQRVQPLADELRAIEVDRLDKWLLKLNEQIEADRAIARNVEVAVKVAERRAKLLGIDAPEKVEATVTEVTQEDIALAELVAEARAASAAEEARLRGES